MADVQTSSTASAQTPTEERTMTETIDLGAYFDRINYAVPRTPALDTLRTILVRHTKADRVREPQPLTSVAGSP